jgi:G patch domain-containing protein 1
MDDEDLAEIRESRQLVDENEETAFGSTASELRRRGSEEDAEDECVR